MNYLMAAVAAVCLMTVGAVAEASEKDKGMWTGSCGGINMATCVPTRIDGPVIDHSKDANWTPAGGGVTTPKSHPARIGGPVTGRYCAPVNVNNTWRCPDTK